MMIMKVRSEERDPVTIQSQNPKVPSPFSKKPIRKLAPKTSRNPRMDSQSAVGSFFAVIL
jgi:hypothetical protein